jgi:hypothetical protein
VYYQDYQDVQRGNAEAAQNQQAGIAEPRKIETLCGVGLI